MADPFLLASPTYRAALRHPHKTGEAFEVVGQAAYDRTHRGWRRWLPAFVRAVVLPAFGAGCFLFAAVLALAVMS